MTNKNSYFSFLAVKLFAISYYAVIYFILGFTASVLLNKVMPDFDVPDEYLDDKNKRKTNKMEEFEHISLRRLFVEIIINFAIIGISFFFVRKIVKNYVPFPLEGFNGFQKSRLTELQGGIIISAIYFAFQTKLIDKLKYLKRRLNL